MAHSGKEMKGGPGVGLALIVFPRESRLRVISALELSGDSEAGVGEPPSPLKPVWPGTCLQQCRFWPLEDDLGITESEARPGCD